MHVEERPRKGRQRSDRTQDVEKQGSDDTRSDESEKR